MATIHIIAPFINANGGDWRAIDMYLEFRQSADVHLWSQQAPHPHLADYPIQVIRAYQGHAPNGGTLYISGSATAIGRWYDEAQFTRIVLIHNLCDQDVFYRSMHRLSLNGLRQIDIAYASQMVKDTIGLPGEIHYPIPHPERFYPAKKTEDRRKEKFTIGRISSDIISKHHYRDVALYHALAKQGFEIKIVGGTCLTPWLGDTPNIELLPTINQHDVPAMLATFDCFYYRVSAHLKEAFGIVVAEAIAAGLPVVAYDEGGYSEILRNYKKGFLFETNQEALNLINQLNHYRHTVYRLHLD